LNNLISFAGIFVVLLLAWLLSTNKKVINWRVIFWGLLLQFVIAIFIFVIPIGTKFFLFVNDMVVKILDCASVGTRFVFGRLALPPGSRNEAGEESLGFILAFQALPAIVFFSSLMAVLYHFGVMSRLIKLFSNVFSRFMKISGAESLSVSSNIFVGVESNMTVLPFLKNMTRSEFCTIMTAGMATTASNVLALYVFLLHEKFPTIAGHLVSGSVLSVISAIVISKIMVPEIDKPETLGVKLEPYYKRSNNFMEAIIEGANEGIKMIVGIVALLLAFLSLVSLFDYVLSFFGSKVGDILNLDLDISLVNILSYVFYPLTIMIGVPVSDAFEISRLIGERAILTEVKSYQDLAILIQSNAIKDARSYVIATYALNGFAHIASLAVFVGGTSALVPERLKDISSVGFRALIAATLSCLMTAAIAGTFFSGSSILFR